MPGSVGTVNLSNITLISSVGYNGIVIASAARHINLFNIAGIQDGITINGQYVAINDSIIDRN